ncbi:MAG: endonuclease domain-containing protein [Alphaproteobacteria bacterium]|nr:endonuclease domain-containing protein [Alphaproteobacteria bacterium]
MKDRASKLRKNQTPAEIKIWGALRKRSLGGHRLVRQAQIGPYIVDFLCREKAFIIEVDGATHSSDEEVAFDKRRSRYLESQGYVIHRIDNFDVYKHLNESLSGILAMLDARPSLFRPKNPLSPSDSSPSKLVERDISED